MKYTEKIPEPINKIYFSNIKKDIHKFQYILINDTKLYFRNFIFDNNYFTTLKINPNLKNNNSELFMIIINFIFSKTFNLNNNHILLCFNLLENLLFSHFQPQLINNNKYLNQIFDIIDLYYIDTLKQINNILFKNNSDLNNEIFKYSYSLFEECFNLNKKDINEIINSYYSQIELSSYTILESSPNFEEKLQLKYLFQKFISLHDLQILSNPNNKISNNNLLYKNMPFPLNLIKNELFNIGGKIILKEYEIKQIEVYFIKSNNNSFLNEIKEKLIMFIYNNYLFFALSPENVDTFDINAIDDQEYYFIKYKYPLRNIILQQNILNNELLLLFQNDSKFRILLKFENNHLFNKGKKIINNGISNSTLLEYSSISSFINNYIGDYYKNNK